MTMPKAEPDSTPRTRSRRRRVLTVAVMIFVVGGAVAGWRWHADRSYVGTETSATLLWGGCANGIFWIDPANGVRWWAGSRPVMTGALETEPPHHLPSGGTTYVAAGTMRFTSYDEATFTSAAGGNLAFTRPAAGEAFTTECLFYPSSPGSVAPTG